MRRPIAFQAVDEGDTLYALCDDGSLWIRWADKNDPCWHEAPLIPGSARESALKWEAEIAKSALVIPESLMADGLIR